MPTPDDAATLPSHSPDPPRALHLAEDGEGAAEARRAARRARLIAVGHPSVTDPADRTTLHGSGPATAAPPTPTWQ